MIRKVFSTLFLFMLSGFLTSMAAQTVQVKVTDVRSNKGKLMLALFKTPDGFPFVHQKAFKLLQLPAQTGTMEVAFEQVPAGNYAVALYHDENSDAKLNTNSLSIPREGYAFSNNVRPRFSAPRFIDASFEHKKSSDLQLRVRY